MFDLEQYLSELAWLVNTDTGRGNADGIAQVEAFFAERLAAIGYAIEIVGVEAGFPCLVAKNRTCERYDALLVGHLDTVFSMGEAERRPFRRDSARAYGPGVIDMKQGALAILYLLEALPKTVSERLNIAVVLNADEEIGSAYSREIIDAYAKKSSFAFVFEAASTDGSRCICRKGRYSARVEFSGISGHAGFLFENGAKSAIHELLYWGNTLSELSSREKGISVNIGVIGGGDAYNIVADHAMMELEARYSDILDYQDVIQKIEMLKNHAEECGIGITVRDELSIPPMVPSAETLAYEGRLEKIGQETGVPYKSKKRGGLSDANHISLCSSVCIDGLAPTGDFDHTDREYLEIATIEPNLRFAYAMLCDLEAAKNEIISTKTETAGE